MIINGIPNKNSIFAIAKLLKKAIEKAKAHKKEEANKKKTRKKQEKTRKKQDKNKTKTRKNKTKTRKTRAPKNDSSSNN